MGNAICAVATPNGHSAIGVIRVSGKHSHTLIGKIFKPANKSVSLITENSAKVVYGKIISNRQLIDDCIVLLFPEAKSYTGEESAEIHSHGNPMILKKILKALYEVGFTPANPGEFTRRAYLGGKIDLTQAEAIREVIEARSERQLQKAMMQKEGLFRKKINLFRSNMLNITADLTAQLDFSDEGLEFESGKKTAEQLGALMQEVRELIGDAKRNELLKNGIEMVITGAPNAGKSSLMNSLTGKNRSIVSEVPGTTRDYIDVQMEIAGIPIVLVDTAGIRKISDDERIEKMGIDRTLEKYFEADVRLMVLDASVNPQENLFRDLKMFLHPDHSGQHVHRSILILNKWDIVSKEWEVNLDKEDFWKSIFKENAINDELFFSTWNKNIIPVSCKTRFGIDSLVNRLEEVVENILPHSDSINLAPWQNEILEKMERLLGETMELLMAGTGTEILVENLRQVMDTLSELTGEITNEDLLGRIFSRFCIGK